MINHKEIILALKSAYLTRYRELNPSTHIDLSSPMIIAGEWAGRGIQRKVAISQLDHCLIIISIFINNSWQPDHHYTDIEAPES